MNVKYVEYDNKRYRINMYENKPVIYVVKRVYPEAKESHVVKLLNNSLYCDCQGFKFRKICNHIHALKTEVEKNGQI